MDHISASEHITWMGGNDLATENRWAWASNGHRIYPYVNWAEEQPSGPINGHCIALKGETLQWSRENCEKTKANFICEACEYSSAMISHYSALNQSLIFFYLDASEKSQPRPRELTPATEKPVEEMVRT